MAAHKAEKENDVAEKADGLDPAMISLLVCPLTKRPLTYDRGAGELISESARLAYPIRGGIAVLLPSEARALEETELSKSK